VFVIGGDRWTAYEVTSTTCVAGFTATRTAVDATDREATFAPDRGPQFFVRSGGTADHKVLHFEGAVSDRRMDRIPRLPRFCDRPTANTRRNNFEVFTRTYAEHYVSFDLKHVNWDSIVAAAQPKVTVETSPAELFEILAGMIRPFGDAHTFISAPAINAVFRGFRPGTERAQPTVFEATDHAYLVGPLQKFCEDWVQYSHLDAATGYLRILSFQGYSPAGTFAANLSALESALDTIFSDPALRTLVIDVRVNRGGSDALGLAVASRLATRDYLAYAKEARADPVDRTKWTPRDPSIVIPSSRPGFRGPVVELIGPSTVSGGETFTQALIGRTPHITRIGENTQGCFSDVLTRRLPNEWRFGLSNEVYLTPGGAAFEGAGIPPDIRIPVFARADLTAGRDPAMAKAIDVFQSGHAGTSR